VPNILKNGIRDRSRRLEAALFRLEALINWEKRARGGRRGMRVSIEPALDLCERLGFPQTRFRAIHVAGSKGKGSVSSLVATALRCAGIREGLYSSPHVESVEERVLLGGEPIDGDRLGSALEEALAAREAALASGSAARDATWFDVLTAAAFLALARAEVEVAVVECGLGGRLDSTNVLRASVCAITSIYLEHTAILGSTRTAIAGEKAGIVKQGSTVVAGVLWPGDEAALVIEHVARERGARFVPVELADELSLEERNQRLAAAILSELERLEPALVAAHGPLRLDARICELARLPGRAERRWLGETRVVLDGAHVPESLELVLRDLARDRSLAPGPVVVLGMGMEKDARGLLKALLGRVDRVLCTSVGEGPYRGADELLALAEELGITAQAVPDPRAALDEAVRVAGTSRWVLVSGSLHLVGAVRGRTRL